MWWRNLCCCFSLHAGCLVIAVLGFVGGFVFVGVGSAFVHMSLGDNGPVDYGLRVLGSLMICDGLISLLACAMLCAGTSRAHRGLLVPYIIVVRPSV